MKFRVIPRVIAAERIFDRFFLKMDLVLRSNLASVRYERGFRQNRKNKNINSDIQFHNKKLKR